jgi:hypothetical protein
MDGSAVTEEPIENQIDLNISELPEDLLGQQAEDRESS